MKKLFNKALVKIIAILAALSMALTVTLVAYGEGEQGGDQTSSVASVSSTVPATSSEATPTVSSEVSSVVSSTPEVSSEQTPVESAVPSETVSSEVVSSDAAPIESAAQTVSSKTSNTSSKKKKLSSNKGKNSKVDTTGNEQSQVTNYYTPSYDAGSMSGKWEGEHTELEETSSVRELSKHLINPKKELLKWIWLPVLIALLCIGALIYINVYVYGPKNSKLQKGEDGFTYAIGDDFIYLDETDMSEEAELQEDENNGEQEDPFSAENFFNFDND